MAGMLRQRWAQQPQGPLRIDWNNPITARLVFCAVPVGGTYLDLVTGVPGTPQGSSLTQSLHASNGGGLYAARTLETTGGSASTDGYYWPVSTLRGGTMTNVGTLLSLAGSNVQADGFTYPAGGNTDGLATGDGVALHIDSFALNGRGNVVRGKYNTGIQASLGQLLGNPFPGRLHFFGFSFNSNGANGTYFGNGAIETWSSQVQTHGTTTTNRQACVLSQSVAVPSSTVAHNAYVGLFLMWERELSAGDYLSLYSNPWQLFAPLPSSIWLAAAAADILMGQACL